MPSCFKIVFLKNKKTDIFLWAKISNNILRVSGKLPPGNFPPRRLQEIKLPPGESPPPRKIPTSNIPIHFFKYFHLGTPCNLYRWYYLKDCFVILYFKSVEVRNSEVCLPATMVTYSKKFCWSSMIISHYYISSVSFECYYLWSFSWGMWCYRIQSA